MQVLAVIIPVFNQWELTEACLRSLAACTPGDFYQVVVVDNGSKDETADACPQLLDSLFPERNQYLRQPVNLKFGPACNAGAAVADATYLFFLNNDTELVPGWLEPLFKAMRGDPRLGAVSPLLLYPDTNRVQHLGVAFDLNLHPVHLYHGFPFSHPAVQRLRSLQAISAAALFMPRDLFQECGGFHGGFLNGSEDLDLCCRLAKRGLRVGCEPRSVILHHASRSEGRFDHVAANARLLDQRCRGCFATDLHRFARKDGFDIMLSDWLEPYLVESSSLQAYASVNELEEFLEAYPLQRQGYAMLVDRLLAEKRVEEAFQWQEVAAGFFPDLRLFRRAGDLAGEVGDFGREAHWRARAKIVEAQLADSEKLLALAKENLDWFRRAGFVDLATLYKSWLITHDVHALSSEDRFSSE